MEKSLKYKFNSNWSKVLKKKTEGYCLLTILCDKNIFYAHLSFTPDTPKSILIVFFSPDGLHIHPHLPNKDNTRIRPRNWIDDRRKLSSVRPSLVDTYVYSSWTDAPRLWFSCVCWRAPPPARWWSAPPYSCPGSGWRAHPPHGSAPPPSWYKQTRCSPPETSDSPSVKINNI